MNPKFAGSVASGASAALVWSELLGHTLPHAHPLPPMLPSSVWGQQSIYAGTSTGTEISYRNVLGSGSK